MSFTLYLIQISRLITLTDKDNLLRGSNTPFLIRIRKNNIIKNDTTNTINRDIIGHGLFGDAIYRELGVDLKDIGKILASPFFDGLKALKEHHQKLLDKRNQLDLLIENVKKQLHRKMGDGIS